MLKDLRSVTYEKPVVSEVNVEEFPISSALVEVLDKELGEFRFKFGRYTSFEIASESAKEGRNYAILPNQYLVYAQAVYEIAIEIYKYIEIYDQLKGYKDKLRGDKEKIAREIRLDASLRSIFKSEDDIDLFSSFLDSSSNQYRLGAKSLFNEKGPRGTRDCFSSVVLKCINVPDNTSLVLGKLIYALCKKESVYKYLVSNEWKSRLPSVSVCSQYRLSKPFLLLAGISGTGKSRFVREQAERNPAAQQKIISVRPDWHEPSDLLGYVSRLSADGDQYIVTDALRFMFSAWQTATDFVEFSEVGISGSRADLEGVPPFWLGLDEMNLAPVEQYFADYLSVIESRKWLWEGDDFTYSCEPLLSAEHCRLIKATDKALRESLDAELWDYLEQYGMPVPFNLIVAGTVNMDETTHGFSRKVIDRALTIDYGEFAPNNFKDYFAQEVEPRVFSYPTLSVVKQNDFVGTADEEGQKSIDFLKAINGVLKDTPFELAYRALNELLISVVCEKPADEAELKAVWDDFLMTKVLPRIEGDADKLWEVTKDGKTQSILVGLQNVVQEEFGDAKRKDLFLQSQKAENTKEIDYRSPKKIKMMAKRLESAGFTSFWP